MKKILFILPFLLLLLLPVSVCAAEFGDINVSIPEELKDTSLPYYVIWEDLDSTYLALTSKPAKINNYNEQNDRIDLYGEYALYTLIDDTWNIIAYRFDVLPSDEAVSYPKSFEIYHHSNYNLMHDGGELVFTKAPIKVSFIEKIQALEMGAVMRTVVSLIPLLMVLLISFLGFRKALAWLLKVLQTS